MQIPLFITAFETVYFWPDFVNALKEVRRVLKDDGIFFIAMCGLLTAVASSVAEHRL